MKEINIVWACFFIVAITIIVTAFYLGDIYMELNQLKHNYKADVSNLECSILDLKHKIYMAEYDIQNHENFRRQIYLLASEFGYEWKEETVSKYVKKGKVK